MRRAALCLTLLFVFAIGALAHAEVIQHGALRISVAANMAPKRLPRSGTAAVRFGFAARFAATQGEVPPQLRRIEVEINRDGQIEPAGLPVCEIDQIQPATTANALRACRSSLVGEGSFSAKVLLTQQSPFPSAAKLLAFNGTWKGRPAILAHIYGPRPVPTSYTVPFVISTVAKGTFGTSLQATLPDFSGKWGYVTGISMSLGRSFSSHGRHRSYLSAGCPAPKGLSLVSFPLSRTSFAFTGGQRATTTLTRSCKAK